MPMPPRAPDRGPTTKIIQSVVLTLTSFHFASPHIHSIHPQHAPLVPLPRDCDLRRWPHPHSIPHACLLLGSVKSYNWKRSVGRSVGPKSKSGAICTMSGENPRFSPRIRGGETLGFSPLGIWCAQWVGIYPHGSVGNPYRFSTEKVRECEIAFRKEN